LAVNSAWVWEEMIRARSALDTPTLLEQVRVEYTDVEDQSILAWDRVEVMKLLKDERKQADQRTKTETDQEEEAAKEEQTHHP